MRLPETTIGKDAKNQNELGFPTMQLFGIKGQRDKLKILPRAGTAKSGMRHRTKRDRVGKDVQKQEKSGHFLNYFYSFCPGT